MTTKAQGAQAPFPLGGVLAGVFCLLKIGEVGTFAALSWWWALALLVAPLALVFVVVVAVYAVLGAAVFVLLVVDTVRDEWRKRRALRKEGAR